MCVCLFLSFGCRVWGGARLVPDRFLVGCVRLCGDGLIYGGGDGDDIGDVVCGYVVVGDGVGFVGSY